MKPKVFFASISRGENLSSLGAKAARLAEAAGFAGLIQKDRPCAVKQHFGEGRNEGYVRPEVTRAVVDFIARAGGQPFVTDTNTLYKGRRSDAVAHLRQAADHGFTHEALGAPVIIADGLHGTEQLAVPVRGTKHFKEVYLATALHHAASCVVLTHVKGHVQFGLGGSIKNVGMGCAGRKGKHVQHQGGHPEYNEANCVGCGTCAQWCPADAIEMAHVESGGNKARMDFAVCIGCGECLALCPSGAIGTSWAVGGVELMEKAVEHALGFMQTKPLGVGYINFVNHLTKNCDCVGSAQSVDYPDLGILASTDLVAIDKATADLCLQRYGRDIFRTWWPQARYETVFTYGAEIGLGSGEYELVEV